jgi:hypothetical protein
MLILLSTILVIFVMFFNYAALKAALGELVSFNIKTLTNAILVSIYAAIINFLISIVAFALAFILVMIGFVSKLLLMISAGILVIILSALVIFSYIAILYIAEKL